MLQIVRHPDRSVKQSSSPSFHVRTRNAIFEEIQRALRYFSGRLIESGILPIRDFRINQVAYWSPDGVGRFRISKGQRIVGPPHPAPFVVDIFLNDPIYNRPVSSTTLRRMGGKEKGLLSAPRYIRHCLPHELFEIVVRIADHICEHVKGERLNLPEEKWTESAANAVKNGGTCLSVRRTLSTYRPSPAKPSDDWMSEKLRSAFRACDRAKIAVVRAIRKIGLTPCNDRHEGLIVAQKGGDVALWVRVQVKSMKEQESCLLRFAFCCEADQEVVPRVLKKFGQEYRAVTHLQPFHIQCHINEAASHAEYVGNWIIQAARKAGV